MNNALLATKLQNPPARKNLVPRPRLAHRLNEAPQQGQKLILLSASAGYGKTTLVTEWLHGLQTKSTWLSLDRTDNDPARFLAYLIAALQQVDASIGQNTRALLQSPQPLPLARLRARGQMVEIRQDDLRFSPEESSDFLQRVIGLDLAEEDILALERRTEGWIAGLQLAALYGIISRLRDLGLQLTAVSGEEIQEDSDEPKR